MATRCRPLAIMASLVAISACSNHDSESSPHQGQEMATTLPSDAPEPSLPAQSGNAVAVLSCKVNGVAVSVAACLLGKNSSDSGSLKITSGGEVKQYSPYELASQSENEFSIPLVAPFEIKAQASEEPEYVLHLEVRRNGNRIFQDEVNEFGSIQYSSSSN